MKTNPLKEVSRFGQSIWYDNIQRSLITGGGFKRMIEQDDLRGVTSNPTIFDKAISQTGEYDADIRTLAAKGLTAEEIYWELVLRDIRETADVFRPVYDRTAGLDGFVSIEVSPDLARDTQGTIQQGKELHRRAARPNVMIKVPATREGIPAVEALVAEGIPVNVTLIFSIERYREVMDAYLAGLEALAWKKRPLDKAASVASFFVSRLDTAVDAWLQAKIASAPAETAAGLRALCGKAAVAQSKLAYQAHKKVFGSARFAALKIRGARVQRPLWASTSTKNPAYPDLLYVETLIGPDTVNTVPPPTLDAFRDHGRAASTLEDGAAAAEKVLADLGQAGLCLSEVTQKLEGQGVDSFCQSFRQLLHHLESRRTELAGHR